MSALSSAWTRTSDRSPSELILDWTPGSRLAPPPRLESIADCTSGWTVPSSRIPSPCAASRASGLRATRGREGAVADVGGEPGERRSAPRAPGAARARGAGSARVGEPLGVVVREGSHGASIRACLASGKGARDIHRGGIRGRAVVHRRTARRRDAWLRGEGPRTVRCSTRARWWRTGKGGAPAPRRSSRREPSRRCAPRYPQRPSEVRAGAAGEVSVGLRRVDDRDAVAGPPLSPGPPVQGRPCALSLVPRVAPPSRQRSPRHLASACRVDRPWRHQLDAQRPRALLPAPPPSGSDLRVPPRGVSSWSPIAPPTDAQRSRRVLSAGGVKLCRVVSPSSAITRCSTLSARSFGAAA